MEDGEALVRYWPGGSRDGSIALLGECLAVAFEEAHDPQSLSAQLPLRQMTDIPPPPGATPPPPPPPNLTPPPGYTAYAPSYMTSVALKRIQGLTTWIVVLTAIVGAISILTTFLVLLAGDEARDFLADRITDDDFVEAYSPALLLGFVQGRRRSRSSC